MKILLFLFQTVFGNWAGQRITPKKWNQGRSVQITVVNGFLSRKRGGKNLQSLGGFFENLLATRPMQLPGSVLFLRSSHGVPATGFDHSVGILIPPDIRWVTPVLDIS